MREDKKEQVFKKLINKQLEPHNKTFEDVKEEPNWYDNYTTTPEKEEEFRQWGIELLRKELRWSKMMSEKEIGWFLLNYGLRTLREN